MSEMVVRQFQYENDSWKRMLAFFQEENVYFRNRLAEVLEKKMLNGLLEKAEYFQTEFIAQDATIKWLKNEINQQEKLLDQNMSENNGFINMMIKNQKKLRKTIEKVELQFNKLKVSFNSFLNETLML